MVVHFYINGLSYFGNTQFAKMIKPEITHDTAHHVFYGATDDCEMLVHKSSRTSYRKDIEHLTIKEWMEKYFVESATLKDFQNAVAEAHSQNNQGSLAFTRWLDYQRLDWRRIGHYIEPVEGYKIAFVPKERLGRVYPPDQTDKFIVSTTLGRFLRKLIPDATDKEIETRVNQIKATFYAQDVKIDLVSGEDIRYWYHEDRYNHNTDIGDLGNSCMRYNNCQSSLDLYVENPSVCRLLIAKKDNLLVGRTLVWTTNDGVYYDRIYSGDAVRIFIREYCKKQGWNSAYNDEDVGNLTITLEKGTFSAYPYMDTFYYHKGNEIANHNLGGHYTLRDVPPEDDHLEEDNEPELIIVTITTPDETHVTHTDSEIYLEPEYEYIPNTIHIRVESDWGSYNHQNNGFVNVPLMTKWKEALESGTYEIHDSEYYMKVERVFGKEKRTYSAFGVLIDILAKDGIIENWTIRDFTIQNDPKARRSHGVINGRFRTTQNDIWRHLVNTPNAHRQFLRNHTWDWFCSASVQEIIDLINAYLRTVNAEVARWSG